MVALFLACGNKSKPYVEEYVLENENPSLVSDEGKVYVDSIRNTDSKTSTTGASYSSGRSSVKYDNMRGFDPASEDDMDDNGMSRYMENNDDEGWD